MRQIFALGRAFGAIPWFFYQAIMAGALLVAAPFILARRGKHYKETLLPRLGFSGKTPSSVPGERLWIHAVSVGEVGVAATLIRSLPEDLPLVVTTVTPTGQERAVKTLGQRAAVDYLPFDFGGSIRSFLKRYRPGAVILTEGDLWPLLERHLRRRGCPMVVINGRISDRSFRRMKILKPFLSPLLRPISHFGVQTSEDRRRLLALGVGSDRVTVTGNLKYETPEPSRQPLLEEAFGALAADRPILLAGSTMRGEEEEVLDALEVLGGRRAALLVLAPRHPERWDEVATLLERRDVSWIRRSGMDLERSPSGAKGKEGNEPASPAVVLLDSLGELAGLYRIAAAAFVGGTLVATGGHNPLEPARFAVATAVGSSMENFREIARHFDDAGAWARVGDGKALGRVWKKWLEEPEGRREVGRRGLGLIEENRGALEKTRELLEPVLGGLSLKTSESSPGAEG